MNYFDILFAKKYSGGGGGGGTTDTGNLVRFIDYDGTVLDSYTPTEFAELSSMPANPSHEGLTAQGWNWTLTDAKIYVAKYGRLNIGQMYITSDGKTRIKIKLEDGRLSPVLGLGVNGTVDVDWGDGTEHGTMTGSSTSTTVQLQHIYASEGEYTITLSVTGSIGFTSYYDQSVYTSRSSLLRKQSGSGSDDRVYQNSVIAVNVGGGVTSIGSSAFSSCYSLSSITIPSGVTSIGSYAFQYCYSLSSITIPSGVTSIGQSAFSSCCSLSSITIPSGVTSIGQSAFQYCYSLSSITIPSGVTSIGSSAFSSCYSLSSITIPSGVTSIGSYAFQYCYSLSSITIPSGVTSIGQSAFSSCYGLGFVKFSGSTPPTVDASNTWNNLQTDCIIYVPTGSLADYEGGTNYPDPDVYTYTEY